MVGMRNWIVSSLLLLALVSFTGSLGAQESAPTEGKGYHQHDGFFLRILLGIGEGQYEDSANVGDGLGSYELETSGDGSNFSFAIGAAITKNLILYGGLNSYGFDLDSLDANIRIGDQNYNADGDTGYYNLDPEMHVTSFPAFGIAYYFTPVNIYLSAEYRPQSDVYVDYGFYVSDAVDASGFSLMLGYEGWVSDNWGFGIAFVYLWDTLEIVDFDEEIYYNGNYYSLTEREATVQYIGLALSLTYN